MANGHPSVSVTRRLMHELQKNNEEPNEALLHLGLVSDGQILQWEAVLKGVQGSPYEGGLWKLSISIPPTYPLAPPSIKFVTRICHPNVNFRTGEICFSLLNSDPSNSAGWSPAYTISSTLSAIQQLLIYPGLDSPLNVDIANLLKDGDTVGAESLVRYYTHEYRWEH